MTGNFLFDSIIPFIIKIYDFNNDFSKKYNITINSDQVRLFGMDHFSTSTSKFIKEAKNVKFEVIKNIRNGPLRISLKIECSFLERGILGLDYEPIFIMIDKEFHCREWSINADIKAFPTEMAYSDNKILPLEFPLLEWHIILDLKGEERLNEINIKRIYALNDDGKNMDESILCDHVCKDKNDDNNNNFLPLIIKSNLEIINPILKLEWTWQNDHETLNTKVIKLHSIDTLKINGKDILIVSNNKTRVSLFEVQECDWKIWNLSKTISQIGMLIIESDPNYMSYFGFIRNRIKIPPRSQVVISGHYIPLKKGYLEMPKIKMLNETQDIVISEFITNTDKIFCTDF